MLKFFDFYWDKHIIITMIIFTYLTNFLLLIISPMWAYFSAIFSKSKKNFEKLNQLIFYITIVSNFLVLYFFLSLLGIHFGLLYYASLFIFYFVEQEIQKTMFLYNAIVYPNDPSKLFFFPEFIFREPYFYAKFRVQNSFFWDYQLNDLFTYIYGKQPFLTSVNNITHFIFHDYKVWFYAGPQLEIYWSTLLDGLSLSLTGVVLIISTIVQIYSIEYMKEDKNKIIFFSYLNLFTAFMLILITSNNLVQLFIGWEGVGLCSYLLINFWFTRVQANKSAIKALVLNRVGDYFFIVATTIFFVAFQTLDFDIALNHDLVQLVFNFDLIHRAYFFESVNLLEILTFFFFCAAIGKSAQIGLHVWLPDAMEGPTPVSALIHAATMVTAGIFLILRTSILFEFSYITETFVLFTGLITAFFAGTVGLFQYDIKRIIAYSTCSQLGYMIFTCGLHNFSLSFFHLINHAFFKALLFLSAGAVIHAVSDEQDIRKMGNLWYFLPIAYRAMLIGSLTLIGFPFLSGFYSKDFILETSYTGYNNNYKFVYFISLFTALLTAAYSFRLIYFVFLNKNNKFNSYTLNKIKENNIYINFSLIILSIFSIVFGFFFKDIYMGNNFFVKNFNFFWTESINVNYDNEFILPNIIKIIIVAFPLIIIAVFIFVNFVNIKNYSFSNKDLSLLGEQNSYLHIYYNNFFILFKNNYLKNQKIFFNKKWFFDSLFNYFISSNVISKGYFFSYYYLDKTLVETLFYNSTRKIIRFFKKMNLLCYSTNFINYNLVLFLNLIIATIIIAMLF